MRLRGKPKERTGRQRLRKDPPSEQPTSRIMPQNTGRNTRRDTQKPKKIRSKNFWVQRLGLIILLIAGLVSLINILSLSGNANVLPLTHDTSSSLLRDQSEYEAAADKLLNSSVWNRNKVTIDTGSVSQQMLAQFPELSSVSVTIPLLAHRPLVYVESGQPALILVTGSGSFLVDTNGKALIKAGTAGDLNQPKLPIVNDQSGLDIRLNHLVLPANNVAFIQAVAAQLAAKQFKVESMALPLKTSQLDVKIAGQPYSVKFNLQNNKARQQAGTFLATIAQLKKQNITPTQYVDVRVDGRAYYK